MSSVVPKPRVFGSNLSNKAEASATPVNGKAASAKLLAEQQAKLTAQQAKLEEWQKQKAASSLKAPVATAAKRPSVAAPTTAVTAAPPLQLSTTPHSALSTPTNSAKLASASAANHTTEIFYTPSSSPTSFKQRVRKKLTVTQNFQKISTLFVCRRRRVTPVRWRCRVH